MISLYDYENKWPKSLSIKITISENIILAKTVANVFFKVLQYDRVLGNYYIFCMGANIFNKSIFKWQRKDTC